MNVSTQVYVKTEQRGPDDLVYRCYRTRDGKTPEVVGCIHRSPTAANTHADELMARGTQEEQS